jgi:hypothetical protein
MSKGMSKGRRNVLRFLCVRVLVVSVACELRVIKHSRAPKSTKKTARLSSVHLVV